MYRRNFLFHQYPGGCFTAGKPFMVEVPRPGKYKVTITLHTETPLEKVSVCTDSGNLLFMGSIPGGVFKHVSVINVGNTVPEGWSHVCQNRVITVTVTAETDCLSSLSISEISCPTIYIAGSANRIAAEAHNKIQPEARSSIHKGKSSPVKWEQMLNAYTGQKIAVSDYSHPGLTTESFRKEGHYAAINEYSRPGDFYFFQFAPTGQTAEDWASGGSCRRQLARYIIECRERLAYPVLLTPAACHNGVKPDDHSGQLWKQCLEAYREVSELTTTPIIELHTLNADSCDAYTAAGLVAQEIVRICGEYSEKRYRFLAKCIRTNCY